MIVSGVVRADPRAPGIPGGFEVDVRYLEAIGISDAYPITPKEHGVEFLMENRHLWLRSSRQWAAMRVRATIIRGLRDWLDSHGFLNVDTPIITPAAAEGTTTLFEIDFHGEPAYLAQTGQLYNEANIFAFGKVYSFGPTFRAEKSKTRRHLQEFWMVEPEIAFCTLEQLMDIEEQFVSYVVQRCLTNVGRNCASSSVIRRCCATWCRPSRVFTMMKPYAWSTPPPRVANWCPATPILSPTSSGATILAARMKPISPPSLTGRSLCTTTQRRSRLSTWSPKPIAPMSAAA